MSGNRGPLNNSEVIDLLLTVFEMCCNISNKDSNGLDKLNEDLTKIKIIEKIIKLSTSTSTIKANI